MLSKYLFPNPFTRSQFLYITAIALALIEALRLLGVIRLNINIIIPVILLIISTLYSIFVSRNKINLIFLIYFVYLGLDILITTPPSFFQSWSRLALFIILIVGVGPVLQNEKIRFFRFTLFKYFLVLCSILCVTSFFCYFFGINYMKTEYNEFDNLAAGTFGGLLSHSMLLGPIAGISTLFLSWLGLKKDKRFFILAIFTAGATMFSASRGAFLSTIIGEIILFLTFSRKKTKGITRLIAASAILLLTFPLWSTALDDLNEKNESNEDSGVFNSRTVKFEARLIEINDKPVFGQGFAAIDERTGDSINLETGTVEPGSSWLGIISMTGFVGLAFVLVIFYSTFKSAVQSISIYRSLMLAFLSFFVVHMIIEGYALAGGSVLCFILWLTIGVANDIKYTVR